MSSDVNKTVPIKPTRLFSRRQMLFGLSSVAAAVYVDMRFIEPNWIGIGRHQVPILREGSSPVRIVQLADLHASDDVPLDFIERAVDLAAKESPDLFCLTGDFITNHWDEWNAYSNILERMTKVAPTFASTGNHDGGGWMAQNGGFGRPTKVIAMLERANIRVLMNERQEISMPGEASFELIGLGDLWARDFNPLGLLENDTARLPRVLMSHNPDTKDKIANDNWELMLSGHTHGGQLTLPWGSTPLAPVVDKRYVRGLHSWKNHWLHITKGVGSIKKMRLNCFPEISVIELVSRPA